MAEPKLASRVLDVAFIFKKALISALVAPIVRIAWNGPGTIQLRYLGGHSLGEGPAGLIDAIGQHVRQGPELAPRAVSVAEPVRWEMDIYDARNVEEGEDTPGPFEKRAAETYFFVTPPDEQWPDDQKNQWLTAFNPYSAHIISMRDA